MKDSYSAGLPVLIVGGGPAGLRAAEVIATAGARVVVADRMPSVGRKFLVAGRGGLNLTHSEALDDFSARYQDGADHRDGVSSQNGEIAAPAPAERWTQLLAQFSPGDLRAWAHGLGIETFVGTSGRVFPVQKKAAPLLRRWVERLRLLGVEFRLRHELCDLQPSASGWVAHLATPTGPSEIAARAVVLAMGGASWPQTGSDGLAPVWLKSLGLEFRPWQAANCGYEVAWPADFLAEAEGAPLKNLHVKGGDASAVGELLVTRHGLEGGALYQLGPALRRTNPRQLVLDLKPTFTTVELLRKWDQARMAEPLARAAQAWKLSRAATALLRAFAPNPSPAALAATAKALVIPLGGSRPIAEAISSAGGLAWSELDANLIVRRWPGLYAAGEMLDWEAPTGGYLLQGCFTTGTVAGRAAVEALKTR